MRWLKFEFTSNFNSLPKLCGICIVNQRVNSEWLWLLVGYTRHKIRAPVPESSFLLSLILISNFIYISCRNRIGPIAIVISSPHPPEAEAKHNASTYCIVLYACPLCCQLYIMHEFLNSFSIAQPPIFNYHANLMVAWKIGNFQATVLKLFSKTTNRNMNHLHPYLTTVCGSGIVVSQLQDHDFSRFDLNFDLSKAVTFQEMQEKGNCASAFLSTNWVATK